MSGPAILERVERSLMFAVEFLDPVTGLVVSEGLSLRAEGLPPPVLAPSGRFAWSLDGPAAAQSVALTLTMTNRMYGPPRERLAVDTKPNNGVTRSGLLTSFTLTTTSHYVPPPGTVCAVGTLLAGGGSKAPRPGVKVRIALYHDAGSTPFLSRHIAVTDAAGAFAAVLQGLSDEKPDPVPGQVQGTVRATLRCDDQGTIRNFDPVPPLRLGRVTYLTEPIKWSPDPP